VVARPAIVGPRLDIHHPPPQVPSARRRFPQRAFFSISRTTPLAAVDKTPSALLDLPAIPVITCIQDLLAFLKQPPPGRRNLWAHKLTATFFSQRLGNARFFFAAPAGAAVMRVGVGPGETEVGDELWIVYTA